MRISTNLFSILLLGFGLSGCASPDIKHFPDVHNGMQKDEVIELIGGPQASSHADGRERWIYDRKEIQFESGHVVYVGDRIRPKVSAESLDQMNNSRNMTEEQRLQKEEDLRDARLGAAHGNRPLDSEDKKIRDSIYGTHLQDTGDSQASKPHFFEEIR